MWPLRYSCLISIVLLLTGVRAIGEVVYAVNCGGEAHTDVHGVRYLMHSVFIHLFMTSCHLLMFLSRQCHLSNLSNEWMDEKTVYACLTPVHKFI